MRPIRVIRTALIPAMLIGAIMLAGVLVGLSVLLWTDPAPAFPGGIQGHSNNPGLVGASTCAQCHSGGVGTPTVTFSSPSPVTVGVPSLVTITVTGGPAVVGGFNASFDDFQGQPVPINAETRQAGPEITHSAPKAFAAGELTFTFSWTPPDDTSIALYVSALSANGNGSLTGDSVGTTFGVIQIEQPEPTPTPTATPIPTATPVATATAAPTATPDATAIPSPTPTSTVAPIAEPPTTVSAAAALPYPGPFTNPSALPLATAVPPTPATPAPATQSTPSAVLAVTAGPAERQTTIGLALLAAGATLATYARRRG